MKEIETDVAIIGSGPAGLAASIAAKENGAENVLLIDRDSEIGGIPLQCIHNGFGTQIFKKDLTGPEYVYFYAEKARTAGVEIWNDTFVFELNDKKEIYAMSPKHGLAKINAKAIVLAMGCRERPRGAIKIPGDRPVGVYTAGTLQRLINIEGFMPGKRFVILGSGDIGMIMARRITLEGGKVERVVEILPYLSGLRRNYSQCILDYGIPLELSHTVTRINGRKRLESVTIAAVDENRNIIKGTEETVPCDTLVLSVGLIPENELSKMAGVKIDPLTNGPYVDEAMQTSVEGIFAAGNVVHVYDLVDWVSIAGTRAGKSAALYAKNRMNAINSYTSVLPGENVHHVVPQKIRKNASESVFIQFRVRKPIENLTRIKIVPKGNQNVIFQKVARYVRPSEMIELEIKDTLLDKILKEDAITISTEEIKK
jgi:NADPH-dependent 2,4-dienoyl-CoA reductase/sulfur reductase-like enzyme